MECVLIVSFRKMTRHFQLDNQKVLKGFRGVTRGNEMQRSETH